MKLFKKVFKSLFKIIVATTLYVLSFVLDILILLENKLSNLNMKLLSNPHRINKESIYKTTEEYKSKQVVVD